MILQSKIILGEAYMEAAVAFNKLREVLEKLQSKKIINKSKYHN